MASIRLEIEGLDRALAWFDAYADQVRKGVAAGLYQSALEIMAQSQEIVPVDTGVLRASGTVQLPEVDGDRVSVTLGYGGAASAYAEQVHEDLLMRHKEGKQAKYLETPLVQYQGTLANVVASIQEAK